MGKGKRDRGRGSGKGKRKKKKDRERGRGKGPGRAERGGAGQPPARLREGAEGRDAGRACEEEPHPLLLPRRSSNGGSWRTSISARRSSRWRCTIRAGESRAVPSRAGLSVVVFWGRGARFQPGAAPSFLGLWSCSRPCVPPCFPLLAGFFSFPPLRHPHPAGSWAPRFAPTPLWM